jgi:hypothetical protein
MVADVVHAAAGGAPDQVKSRRVGQLFELPEGRAVFDLAQARKAPPYARPMGGWPAEAAPLRVESIDS